MKKPFKEFIKKAKIGQYFFSAELGIKYRLTKIGKTISNAIEFNKKDFGGENEEVEWDNSETYKVIF